jgi:hypothetical protein
VEEYDNDNEGFSRIDRLEKSDIGERFREELKKIERDSIL